MNPALAGTSDTPVASHLPLLWATPAWAGQRSPYPTGIRPISSWRWVFAEWLPADYAPPVQGSRPPNLRDVVMYAISTPAGARSAVLALSASCLPIALAAQWGSWTQILGLMVGTCAIARSRRMLQARRRRLEGAGLQLDR
jgi:hypothetical protein